MQPAPTEPARVRLDKEEGPAADDPARLETAQGPTADDPARLETAQGPAAAGPAHLEKQAGPPADETWRGSPARLAVDAERTRARLEAAREAAIHDAAAPEPPPARLPLAQRIAPPVAALVACLAPAAIAGAPVLPSALAGAVLAALLFVLDDSEAHAAAAIGEGTPPQTAPSARRLLLAGTAAGALAAWIPAALAGAPWRLAASSAAFGAVAGLGLVSLVVSRWRRLGAARAAAFAERARRREAEVRRAVLEGRLRDIGARLAAVALLLVPLLAGCSCVDGRAAAVSGAAASAGSPASGARGRAADVRPAVFVIDASPSRAGGPAAACDVVHAAIGRHFAKARRTALDVAIFITGDAERTGGSAAPLAGWRRLAQRFRAFEAPEKARERLDADIAALVETCRAGVRAASESRIWIGVVAASAALDARCAQLADEGEACADPLLLVVSDGQENNHPAVKRALRDGLAGKPIGPLPSLRSACGAKPRMCGVDATTSRGSLLAGRPLRPEAVVEVWRRLLGPGAIVSTVCDAL